MTNTNNYIGKLIAWREPSGYRRVAICTGTTSKPSLKHRLGSYLVVEVAGRVRYLDLDDTEVEVVDADHVTLNEAGTVGPNNE